MDKQREELFHFYQGFDSPLLNLTVDFEMPNILNKLKERNIPFFQYIVYCLCKTSQDLVNFRLRFDGEKIYEVKRIIPSYTVLRESQNFNFCTFEYCSNINQFLIASAAAKWKADNSSVLIHDDMSHRDYIFMTCLPWYKFSSIQHPVGRFKDSTIPSFAIGKYSKTDKFINFPMSIQVHHGLVDGVHIAAFLDLFLKNIKSSFLES